MLFIDKKLNPHAYNPLALAYIGDTVYDLFVRSKILCRGNRHVTDMHKEAVSFVKAQAQAKSIHEIENMLTDEEINVFKWGRNAKSNTVPKNAAVKDYHAATGFETLIGFLYMNDEWERLGELLEKSFEVIDNSK